MHIKLDITRESAVIRTPRLMQMEGMFDVPPSKKSMQSWHHDFTLPDQWNIGVIVGPSGAGKTTLAREAFGDNLASSWKWPADKSILDGFPAEMGAKEITGLLSSVGFSSPPAWMRPFDALSNGEQFRVNVARTLAEWPDMAAVDEFTSVVDRTVAKIGSASVAKTVRRRGGKFVAVACHYDILDWLEPDWVYEPHIAKLTLNTGPDGSRGLVWRRPAIELEIILTDKSTWGIFKPHHYLNSELNRSARCYAGLIEGRPAAFVAVLPFPHPKAPGWREHRAVCLPDFQGVGIGNAMSEFVASLYAAQKRYTSCTSHPSMIRHRAKSKAWRMIRKPSLIGAAGSRTISNRTQIAADIAKGKKRATSGQRLTATFAFAGQPRPMEALGFGLKVAERFRRSPTAPEPGIVRSA